MNADDVFQANRASTSRLKQLVQGLSEQQLASMLPNGWTAAVTLSHLAFWDQRVIYVIEQANKEGKVTPSNFDESLNDILVTFLRAIPPFEAATIAVSVSEKLDHMLETCSVELLAQLDAVNHRWVDRSLHRNGHLDEIESFYKN